MNAREELARDIFVYDNGRLDQAAAETEWEDVRGPNEPQYAYQIADGLIAAGYRKPRTITTAEELDALPDGSVLMSGDRYKQYAGAIWRVSRGMVARVGREQHGVTPFKFFIDPLPATVLYEPEAQK